MFLMRGAMGIWSVMGTLGAEYGTLAGGLLVPACARHIWGSHNPNWIGSQPGWLFACPHCSKGRHESGCRHALWITRRYQDSRGAGREARKRRGLGPRPCDDSQPDGLRRAPGPPVRHPVFYRALAAATFD